jgi:hypothetical protein
MKIKALAMCVLMVAVAGQAFATTTVVYDTGVLQNTTALTGFGTNGDMMDGMKVTAYFSNNSSFTAIWADDGASTGKAAGTNWSLSESGDTFSSAWVLSNLTGLGMTRVMIDAGLGDTVFDTTFGGGMSTAGSANGSNFYTSSSLNILATYRNAVGLANQAPVGDLFRILDIQFTGASLATGQSISFSSDTDNLRFAGDIQSAPVPEPVTMVALSMGIVGLGGYIRRRRAAAAK